MALTKVRGITPRVLIIVSDRRQIEELRKHFSALGVECEVALDLETARVVLDERRMDLVIVDVSLPDIKSEPVIKELKDQDCDMKLVLFNGVKEKSEQRRLRRMGADSYLSEASDLNAVVRAAERNLELPA